VGRVLWLNVVRSWSYATAIADGHAVIPLHRTSTFAARLQWMDFRTAAIIASVRTNGHAHIGGTAGSQIPRFRL
jgi:hypothetical protein